MRVAELVEGCSLDTVARHRDELPAAAALLPPGTRVNVGAADDQSWDEHRATAAQIAAHGLTPVPHVVARRIASSRELDRVLSGLSADGSSRHVLALGGDPPTPAGPYDSALALIRAVRFADYGTESVGISGYPEGHPAIPSDVLWNALVAKLAELDAQGLRAEIYTQLALAVDPVLAWIEETRARGISAPIHVGLCGPIAPARLLGYARRVGAASDPPIALRYGIPGPNAAERVGPERFVEDLAARLDPGAHGEVRLHLFSLGGLRVTAEWIRAARSTSL